MNPLDQLPISINFNCSGPVAGGSDAMLPGLTTQTDQYLTEQTKPFMEIPLLLWLAAAAAAVWYFYGRKHWDLSL